MPDSSTDLDQAIRDNASAPRRASSDDTEVESHALTDQIAADRYLQSKQATRAPGLGVSLKKLVPPGTA